MAHRLVHLGGTLLAVSEHSPGSGDRMPHLGRKQKARPITAQSACPAQKQHWTASPPLEPPGQAPAIVVDRPFLPTARAQNQEANSPKTQELSCPTRSPESRPLYRDRPSLIQHRALLGRTGQLSTAGLWPQRAPEQAESFYSDWELQEGGA